MAKVEKQTISLHHIEQILLTEPLSEISFEKKIPSFFIESIASKKYVKPTFSSLEASGIKKSQPPQIILISAAGATGKSELTKYLSSSFNVPIFDLATHAPVGSNSLTGLFFDTLGAKGLASYIEDLETGEAMMIIDALDEGYLKTTTAAFDSFLDGVADVAVKSNFTPFILPGRTNVIEYSTLYLQDKGLSAEMLHLEPFTEEQAREFIDKQLGETNYDHQYRIVRDYIISSVQGFFRNETAMRKEDSKAFIGYAPVLLSISVLLKRTSNFKALYEELQSKDDKGVRLVLEIVSLILKRDRMEKIIPAVRDRLLKDRNNEFSTLAESVIYSDEEQCIRILYFLIGQKPKIVLTDDVPFDVQYEDMVDSWLKEHPFILNGKIQNAVFESYVIAKLMESDEHKVAVLQYMRMHYRGAFMLFFIFESLCQSRIIEPLFLSYLLSSLKSLDDTKNYYGMYVDGESDEDADEAPIQCSVDFFNSLDSEFNYEFVMNVPQGTTLIFSRGFSNVEINAPITVEFKAKRLEFKPPVIITCSKIIVDTSEFVFESKEDTYMVLECDVFEVDYLSGNVPEVINYGNLSSRLSILCNQKPGHPFSEYYEEGSAVLSELSQDNMEKYHRLRKILMQFRSHSKGELAKLKDKIEHNRTLKNNIGWNVLRKLVDTGVIFADEHLYKIDTEALDKNLKLTYFDLKRNQISSATVKFLESI
jgi:hypothetical protein